MMLTFGDALLETLRTKPRQNSLSWSLHQDTIKEAIYYSYGMDKEAQDYKCGLLIGLRSSSGGY